MTEYTTRPTELQTEAGADRSPDKRQRLKQEIEEIKQELERKVEAAREAVHETAARDREDAQRKLDAIKNTLSRGWDNVTDTAADALRKLLR